MELSYILSKVDHTLLKQGAREADIYALCDEGIKYGCASVCIPAAHVAAAARYVSGRIPICTVIGFPNGYSTTAAKCFEAAEAVRNGADEVDMVINVGMVKEGRFEAVRDEIRAVKEACDGRLLKVIIETCLLTDEEKITLCKTVAEGGADFIKTSTGFAGGGATAADIALMNEHRPAGLLIKAAGGISSLEDAELFLKLGADRLGTSRIVGIAKNTDMGENSHEY